MTFVHLHHHTDISWDGIGSIEQHVKHAAQLGMKALAMTDHGTLAGAVTFIQACHYHSIKPILGVEGYITSGQTTGHITLLAHGIQGWKSLVALQNKAHEVGYVEKAGHGMAMFSVEQLFDNSAGVVVLSGCLNSLFNNLPESESIDLARRFQDVFGSRFYIEVQPLGENPEGWNRPLRLARQIGAKTVITNDAHFPRAQDFEVHRLFYAAGFDNSDLYIKSEIEMQEACRIRRIPWNDNASIIADRIEEVDLSRKPVLPDLPEADEWLQKSTFDEIRRRGLSIEYHDRLRYELDILISMGFSPYFYILYDIVDWAIKNGVRVGPGRGSGAGSLVLWLLDITAVDPIKYNLSFERFLNPLRKGYPDVDIDFESERREQVIEYAAKEWNMIGIATYARYQHASMVRELGRRLSRPGELVARAAEDDTSKAFKELMEDNLFNLCYSTMLHQVRHSGKHAGGVVIIDDADIVPIERGANGVLVAAFAESGQHQDLSTVGIVKFDFLGLKALSVLRRLEEKMGFLAPDPEPNDEVFGIFTGGKCAGVFQFSGSPGIVDLTKRIKPNVFEDIVAATALFRPGALDSGLAFRYPRLKREPRSVHPVIDEVLAETYGVCVFQEQFMGVYASVTDGDLAEADLVRRTIVKSKPGDPTWEAQYHELRLKFINGCKAKGLSESKATHFWDNEIATHARYSFNKSHSVAYTLISWYMAWWKYHHPVEFYASMLNVDTKDEMRLLTEAVSEGIEVVPPHVNHSGFEWEVHDGRIYMPISQLKGIAPARASYIVEERNNGGPFISFADFSARIPKKLCNARVKKGLLALGGLEGLEGTAKELGLKEIPDTSEEHPLDIQLANLRGVIIPTAEMVKVATTPDHPFVRGIVVEKSAKTSKAGRKYYQLRLIPENNVRVARDKVEDIEIGDLIRFKPSKFGWCKSISRKRVY